MPNMNGTKYNNINVMCLDGVDMDELMAAPVTYYDGLNDNWGECPAETPHLYTTKSSCRSSRYAMSADAANIRAKLRQSMWPGIQQC
jgi:hypothetical protein